MLGHNEIVGTRYFDGADKLQVTSTFVTLQGEGPFSGLPAVFVRLAKCNLACSFCDTYFDSGDWLSIEELTERLNDEIWMTPLSQDEYILVITGGEPMLQDALIPFIEANEGNYRAIQIESNGILTQPLPNTTTLVVSPKCHEKHGLPTRYLKPKLQTLERADCLKFVMNDSQSSPYSVIPDWAHDWRRDTHLEIYVSPMNIYAREPVKAKAMRNGQPVTINQRSKEEVVSFWEPGLLDLEANQRNHEYTARYAIKHGLRFQLQTHLYASVA